MIRSTRTRGPLAIATVLAMILVFAAAGGSPAQETPGGALSLGGQLVDDGEWIAEFQLDAVEAPGGAPEYFPNGSFDFDEQPDLPAQGWDFGDVDWAWVGEGPTAPSVELYPFRSIGYANVCLGETEPGTEYAVTLDYLVKDLVQEELSQEKGMRPFLVFFESSDESGPCENPNQVNEGGAVLVPEGDWMSHSFSGTVPDGFDSFMLSIDFYGLANSVYLDNVSVTGPASPGVPGIGETSVGVFNAALSLCVTHGDPAEPGREGILAAIGCGAASEQAVSINGCEATIEAHGYVHADAPNTTFLGEVVIDVDLEITNKKNSPFLGTLEFEIFTPKDVIVISGNILKDGAGGFMDTCDKFPTE